MPISGTGKFVDKLPEGYTIPTAFAKNIPCFSFGTQAAEVEVDPETGQVQGAQGRGRPRDRAPPSTRRMAEGQIEGSVAQGIGFALMERLVHEDGRVINDRFLDYKIPNIGDMPEIEAICVESEGTNGPFGAKGIGEPGLVPTAPAIANAIYDAIGVRFHELPITRDMVLEALKERAVVEVAVHVERRGATLADALGLGPRELVALVGAGRQDQRPPPPRPRDSAAAGRRGDRDDDDGHVPSSELAAVGPGGRGATRRPESPELRTAVCAADRARRPAARPRRAGQGGSVCRADVVDAPLGGEGLADYLLVEADGSRGLPSQGLRRRTSRRCRRASTTIVQVAGLDAIGAAADRRSTCTGPSGSADGARRARSDVEVTHGPSFVGRPAVCSCGAAAALAGGAGRHAAEQGRRSGETSGRTPRTGRRRLGAGRAAGERRCWTSAPAWSSSPRLRRGRVAIAPAVR